MHPSTCRQCLGGSAAKAGRMVCSVALSCEMTATDDATLHESKMASPTA